jgi:hypothetical protein
MVYNMTLFEKLDYFGIGGRRHYGFRQDQRCSANFPEGGMG